MKNSFLEFSLKKWIKNAGGKVTTWAYVTRHFSFLMAAKLIYAMQPFLEKIPVLKHIFSRSLIYHCVQ